VAFALSFLVYRRPAPRQGGVGCSGAKRGRFCATLGLVVVAIVAPLRTESQVLLRGRVLDSDGNAVPFARIVEASAQAHATSGLDGAFSLHVPTCPCQLFARRIGFAADSAVFTASDTSVRFHLRRQSGVLTPVSVEAPLATPLAQTVTTASVRTAPAVAEADLFRAIVLLPGVTQPFDRSGRVHLAAGASDETSIRLDGHPLQDPFHMFGLFGAVNVAALESAEIRMNHVPVESRDHLSGGIEIESRKPGPKAERELTVGILSSGFTHVGQHERHGVDALVSVRITYLDKVLAALKRTSIYRGDRFPYYGFRDAVVRVGKALPTGRAELTLFSTADRVTDGRYYGLRGYEPFQWGETLLGTRLTRQRGSWWLEARGSFSTAYSRFDERVTENPNWFETRYDRSSTAFSLQRSGGATTKLGFGLDYWSQRELWSFGPLTRPILSTRLGQQYDSAKDLAVAHTYLSHTVPVAGGELNASFRSSRTDSRSTAEPGFRWLWEMAGNASVTISGERRYQFRGDLVHPDVETLRPPQQLSANPERADVVGIGVTWRPRSGMQIGVQGFGKRYRSLHRLVDRSPGTTTEEYTASFPQSERLDGNASGFFGSVIAESRAMTVHATYTYQRVRLMYVDGQAPADWDVPHSLTVVAVRRIRERWFLSTAAQLRSGLPSTPVAARILMPAGDANGPEVGFRYVYGERNSVRAEPFRRVDLGLQRRSSSSTREWTVTLNVINAFLWANPVDINYSRFFCTRSPGCHAVGAPGKTSLPLIPSVAIEVRW
jgi:hypothetical protein